jgi:hypothetical protein
VEVVGYAVVGYGVASAEFPSARVQLHFAIVGGGKLQTLAKTGQKKQELLIFFPSPL